MLQMDFLTSTVRVTGLDGSMEFGTSCGGWLQRKLEELKEAIDNEADEQIYAVIQKEYLYLMQISCIYVKLDKKHIALSILQWIIYVTILVSHNVLLIYSSIKMMDVNMVIFCQSVHFTLLVQLTTIILTTLQTKHKQMTLFHRLVSQDFFDYQEPPAEGEDALRTAMFRERRILSVIPIGVGLAAGAVLVMAPIIDRQAGLFDFEKMSQMSSTSLPYPYAVYTFQTEEGFIHYLTLAGQGIIGVLLTLVIGAGGFLFLNLAQNVSLQFRRLQNSLDQIETRAEAMHLKMLGTTKRGVKSLYDDYHFTYCYSECLKKNFKHHKIIMRAFDYMQDIISVPVFLAYMTGTIVIALSLISAGSADELPGTTVASMVLCGVEIGYMFLFSVFGQRLGDLNMELRYKMYNMKWYLCDRSVKSSLMIFQERTLKPLKLMAGGIVPADMETFGTVMNSAYSYYNLVNAFGK